MKARYDIMKNMLKCDIIIPVYNAFECLESCIESILENTDFKIAHLVLIDDKSSDERVLPLLEKYKSEYPDKITLLKNSENRGFVKTVNRGMRHSKNDVLLLNSDTEVTNGWLEKIRRCAYLDDYVATVTPLSNNATLASVPNMFEENTIPDGLSLKEMAELVEECSLKEYPEIPTAHGFCMYIRRLALDKVGYFDEIHFGKGYGEENDFSFRCFKYGFRHLLCDDTYILHKESQSFLNAKEMHDTELEKLHPLEKRKLDIWNHTGSIEMIGKNVQLALGQRNRRKNILIIIHDFDIKNLGGTTMHVMDLISRMRKEYNFHVLYPGDNSYIVHSFYKDVDMMTAAYERPMTVEPVQFYSYGYKKMIEEILEQYGVSYVHIHHLIGHCFSLIDACEDKKIKYAVTLHDYYLIEAKVGIIEEKVGSGDNKEIDLKEWRKNSKRLLEKSSEVFAPSKYVKDVFERFFQIKNIRVIEHGVNIEKNEKTWELTNVWNIAFVGVMCPHKGIELLEGIVKDAPSNLKIHLFGTLPKGKKYGKNFVNHGRYERGELSELLKKNKIDLVCILSLWPETYSYTATEAIASGVPVVSFDLGAIGERISNNNLGFTIPYTKDSSIVLGEICKILRDRKRYESVIKSVRNYKCKTVDEMVDEYEQIFDMYLRIKKSNTAWVRDKMISSKRLFDDDGAGNRYKHEFFQILNSKRWKLVSKIRIPESIRKVLKFVRGGVSE